MVPFIEMAMMGGGGVENKLDALQLWWAGVACERKNHKTTQPHTTLSIHVYAVVLNTGGASIFNQKCDF